MGTLAAGGSAQPGRCFPPEPGASAAVVPPGTFLARRFCIAACIRATLLYLRDLSRGSSRVFLSATGADAAHLASTDRSTVGIAHHHLLQAIGVLACDSHCARASQSSAQGRAEIRAA